MARDTAGSREDHVGRRAQLSDPSASHSYCTSMIEGALRNVLHRQRHANTWRSREGHGRVFICRVASLNPVEIPVELSKVVTDYNGILPARSLDPRLTFHGWLLVLSPHYNENIAWSISDQS